MIKQVFHVYLTTARHTDQMKNKRQNTTCTLSEQIRNQLIYFECITPHSIFMSLINVAVIIIGRNKNSRNHSEVSGKPDYKRLYRVQLGMD